MASFYFDIGDNTLYCKEWIVKDPIGSVILIHGLGEYAERFDTTARFYNRHKYNVLAFDLPGHGNSYGEQGHIEDREEVFRAIDLLIYRAHSYTDNTEILIHAHSLGGNLALTYRMYNENPAVKGYIISSPWIELSSGSGAFLAVAGKVISRILYKGESSFYRKVADIVCEGEVAEDYLRDDKIHSVISLKTFMDSSRDGHKILKTAPEITSPVYVFHGNKDKICSAKASQKFAELSGLHVCFEEIDGVGHENMHLLSYLMILQRALEFIKKNKI